MKTLRLCLLSAVAVVAALALSSCNNNQEQMKDSPAAGTPRAIIHTNYGDMTVEFWPEVAPRTVDNFLKLSREKFYDGSAFHRIIKGFQGRRPRRPRHRRPRLPDQGRVQQPRPREGRALHGPLQRPGQRRQPVLHLPRQRLFPE
jgi:hypothetical protein